MALWRLRKICCGSVKTDKKESRRGYTLIELVVVAGLLGVLLIILSGAAVHALRIQRKALARQDLQENLRAVVELFDREVRLAYGTTFAQGQTPDPDRGNAFFLCNQEGALVLWYFFNNKIWRAEEEPSGGGSSCPVSSFDPGQFSTVQAVSSERVIIDEFRVEQVTAAGSAPNAGEPITTEQGVVTVIIRARPAAYRDMPALTLQVTVTSRQIVGI